ncbi:MAG TPA: PLD nuclease N-terminal domain-containing protein [Ktedonobacterales bacterium]
MSSDRQGGGLLEAGCLTLVFLIIPVVGHIVAAVLILFDDLTAAEKLLWLIVAEVFWPIGPFLYLLLGRRKASVFNRRAA